MKKLSIYYLIHIAMNVILVIAFRDSISLHFLSALPLLLFALMIFQTTLFKTDRKSENIGDTAYSVGDTVRLTDEEQNNQFSYLKHSFLLCLPFEIPLIFFLPSYWKLLGLVPYIFAYIIGGVVFKVKMGKQIKIRVEAEKRNLEEQRKREELGIK